jgi:hypothetical protein
MFFIFEVNIMSFLNSNTSLKQLSEIYYFLNKYMGVSFKDFIFFCKFFYKNENSMISLFVFYFKKNNFFSIKNDFLLKKNNTVVNEKNTVNDITSNMINNYFIRFNSSFFVKNLSTIKNNFLFLFLRKNKVFNKGRYSRNRQTYRTGVY